MKLCYFCRFLLIPKAEIKKSRFKTLLFNIKNTIEALQRLTITMCGNVF